MPITFSADSALPSGGTGVRLSKNHMHGGGGKGGSDSEIDNVPTISQLADSEANDAATISQQVERDAKRGKAAVFQAFMHHHICHVILSLTAKATELRGQRRATSAEKRTSAEAVAKNDEDAAKKRAYRGDSHALMSLFI